jgi:hypothetical protein
MTSPQCQRNTRASAVLPLPVMFDLSRSQRVETRFKGATLMDYLMCTDNSYTASTYWNSFVFKKVFLLQQELCIPLFSLCILFLVKCTCDTHVSKKTVETIGSINLSFFYLQKI